MTYFSQVFSLIAVVRPGGRPEDESLTSLLAQLPRVIFSSREDTTIRNYHYAQQQWATWAQWHKLTPLPTTLRWRNERAKNGYVKDSIARLLSVSKSLDI